MTAAVAPTPDDPKEARLERAFLSHYVPAKREGRNYKHVADKLRITVPELIAHAKKFKWQQRYDDIAKKSAAMLADRVAESMADVDERHLRSVRVVQERLMNSLENAVFDDPAKAGPILERLIKLERTILQLDEAEKDTDDLPTRIAKKLAKLTGNSEPARLVEPDYKFDEELAKNPPPLPEPEDDRPSEPPSES